MTLKEKILQIQKEMPKMEKDQSVSFGNTNYKYFDINQIIEKMLPLLVEHKVTVMQPLTHIIAGENAVPAIETIITSGEEEISRITPLPGYQKPQDTGSAITYYRRYALQSFFCMEAEDKDGVVSGKKSTVKKQPTKSPHASPVMKDVKITGLPVEDVTPF